MLGKNIQNTMSCFLLDKRKKEKGKKGRRGWTAWWWRNAVDGGVFRWKKGRRGEREEGDDVSMRIQ